jgi:hypothetical protein
MKQVFDVAQRLRTTNVKHHRQADDLWAGLEEAEGGALGHAFRLAGHYNRLKKTYSDKTHCLHPEQGFDRHGRTDPARPAAPPQLRSRRRPGQGRPTPPVAVNTHGQASFVDAAGTFAVQEHRQRGRTGPA